MGRVTFVASYCHPERRQVEDGLCKACVRLRAFARARPPEQPLPESRVRAQKVMKRGPPAQNERAVYMRQWRADQRLRKGGKRPLSDDPRAVYMRKWRANVVRLYAGQEEP